MRVPYSSSQVAALRCRSLEHPHLDMSLLSSLSLLPSLGRAASGAAGCVLGQALALRWRAGDSSQLWRDAPSPLGHLSAVIVSIGDRILGVMRWAGTVKAVFQCLISDRASTLLLFVCRLLHPIQVPALERQVHTSSWSFATKEEPPSSSQNDSPAPLIPTQIMPGEPPVSVASAPTTSSAAPVSNPLQSLLSREAIGAPSTSGPSQVAQRRPRTWMW